MKLSEINTAPRYPITIPSTGKQTTLRPLFVKEERALMVAKQSEDPSTMLVTLENVIRACVDDVPKDLTSFDAEFLFVHIRAKSVGEMSDVVATCVACGTKHDMRIDLSKVVLEVKPEHTPDVRLSDTLLVKMRYPSIADVAALAKLKDTPEQQKRKAIAMSIDSVYYNDIVWRSDEQELDEIMSFIDDRTEAEYAKIDQFFATIPTVVLTTGFTCVECKKENLIEIRSLADFI